MTAARCSVGFDPGSVGLRRPSNAEHARTVQDVLGLRGLDAKVVTALPDHDYQGGAVDVFDNLPGDLSSSTSTTISPAQLAAYFEIAVTLVQQTFASDALPRIVTCAPANAADDTCATSIVRTFGLRAWRRPLTAGEVADLVALVRADLAAGDSFGIAIQQALVGILASESFLYRIELDPPAPDVGVHPVTSYELATRLSYLVWSTMPDDTLLALADSDDLQKPEVLAAQVTRMLADARADGLVRNFFGQWLGFRVLGGPLLDRSPPVWSASLQTSLQEEARLFVTEVVQSDASIAALLTADVSFLDATLARFYDQLRPCRRPRSRATSSRTISDRDTSASVRSWPRRPRGPRRRASRAASASTPRCCARRHPRPTAAQPAQAPGTPRARYEQLAATPSCAECHKLFEPLGLGPRELRRDRQVPHDLPPGDPAPIDATGAPARRHGLHGAPRARRPAGEGLRASSPARDARPPSSMRSGASSRTPTRRAARRHRRALERRGPHRARPAGRDRRRRSLQVPTRGGNPMSTRRGFSRRDVLRGAGVALALPWLETLAPRTARGEAAPPTRTFVAMSSPRRRVTEMFWKPATPGVGDAWARAPRLAPLAPGKPSVHVLANVGNYGPFGGHIEPSNSNLTAAMLTGTRAQMQNNVLTCGTSVDQLIAQSLAGRTRLDSLQVGLSTLDSYTDGLPAAASRSISWRSPTDPTFKLVDPQAVFDKIAGLNALPTADNALRPERRARNKSVLDYVLGHATTVRGQVSASDRLRMDAYMDSVRALELRVAASPALPACAIVPRPTFTATVNMAPPGYDRNTHADLMIDLVVMALQCDATRVVSFMMDERARSDFVYSFLTMRSFAPTGSTPGTGSVGGLDGLAHAGNTNNGFATINFWFVEKLSRLCQKLQASSNGAGNLLDAATIWFGSEMHGANADGLDLPILTVGKGGGRLKTNQYIDFAETPRQAERLANLHLTFMRNVFDIPITTFGTAPASPPASALPPNNFGAGTASIPEILA